MAETNTEKSNKSTNAEKADEVQLMGLVSKDVAQNLRLLAIVRDRAQGKFLGEILTEFSNAHQVTVTES
jgi:hypothetical protein